MTPPTVAWLRTRGVATSSKARLSAGQRSRTRDERSTARCVVMAPSRSSPFLSIPRSSATPRRLRNAAGTSRRWFRRMPTKVPPATTVASSPQSPRNSSASSIWPEQDTAYRSAHSERSARIVGDWLRGEGADEALVSEVERLIVGHESGGDPDEDLVQAADSLSFLETNQELIARWVKSGRCSRERAKAQHRWMLERIKVER